MQSELKVADNNQAPSCFRLEETGNEQYGRYEVESLRAFPSVICEKAKKGSIV